MGKRIASRVFLALFVIGLIPVGFITVGSLYMIVTEPIIKTDLLLWMLFGFVMLFSFFMIQHYARKGLPSRDVQSYQEGEQAASKKHFKYLLFATVDKYDDFSDENRTQAAKQLKKLIRHELRNWKLGSFADWTEYDFEFNANYMIFCISKSQRATFRPQWISQIDIISKKSEAWFQKHRFSTPTDYTLQFNCHVQARKINDTIHNIVLRAQYDYIQLILKSYEDANRTPPYDDYDISSISREDELYIYKQVSAAIERHLPMFFLHTSDDGAEMVAYNMLYYKTKQIINDTYRYNSHYDCCVRICKKIMDWYIFHSFMTEHEKDEAVKELKKPREYC